MKNRAIKSVIAAATTFALLGSGVAVAEETAQQTQSTNASSSNKDDKKTDGNAEDADNSGSSSLGDQLPYTEINGKKTTGLIAIIGALNAAVEVIGKMLESVLSLVEGFQKLAPKPAEAK